MASTAAIRRIKVLVPLTLLTLVGSLVAGIVTAAPRTPPAMLGASGRLDGGLGRINGVIPLEADGWTPPSATAALAGPADAEMHRVRILVELTAVEKDGISFDPSRYAVSALGGGSWKPVWATPEPALVKQGKSINATLVFELPDRAIDLTLEMPGGPGLSLGAGHHRDAKVALLRGLPRIFQEPANPDRESPSSPLHSPGIEQGDSQCPFHAARSC